MSHIPGRCPFCDRPDLYPIYRDWNGIRLHALNVPHPMAHESLNMQSAKIGVEILCLKYDAGAN